MPFTERLAILIEAHGGKAIAEFKKVGAAAKEAGANAEAGGKGLGRFGIAGEAAGNLLKVGIAAGVAAAGAAVTKFAIAGVNSFVNLADEVRKFQRVSGATAESSSQMVAAMHAIGVETDAGSNAVFQLGKRLETSAGKLAAYGIHAVKAADGTTDLVGTLLEVGDAYKATKDPAERAALVFAAFGKSGAAIAPLLGKSREELAGFFDEAAKHHEILSQEDLDKAKAFKLATHDLSEAFSGLEREAGIALVPFLTDVAHATTALLDLTGGLGDLIGKVSSLGGLTETIGKGIGGDPKDSESITRQVRDFVDVIVHGQPYVDKRNAALEAGTVATKDLADTSGMAARTLEEEDKQAAAVSKALFSEESASRALTSAQRDLGRANTDLNEKKKALADLEAKGAVDAKKVAEAQRDEAAAQKALTRASADQADAVTKVKDAEQALADLRSGAAAAKNMADHADDVGKAQLRVHRAETALTKAQDHLNAAQLDGSSTAADLSDAQDDVKQATYDLHDAQLELGTTQDEVNRLAQVGAENSPETIAAVKGVKDANNDLTTATDNVTGANQALIDKHAALVAAMAGDPSFKEDVRKARQDVADATQHVADAEYTVAQRKNDFVEAQKAKTQALSDGADQAARLRDELDKLLKANPDLAPLLGPILGSLATGLQLAVQKQTATNIELARSGRGPAVPQLAAGGIVSASSGGTLVRVAEGGHDEAVIPLDRLGQYGGAGGGGGNAYSLTVYALDSQAASDAVIGAIAEWERRNGTSWRN